MEDDLELVVAGAMAAGFAGIQTVQELLQSETQDEVPQGGHEGRVRYMFGLEEFYDKFKQKTIGLAAAEERAVFMDNHALEG